MIIWGEFSSSLHCVLNPFIYFYTNRTFRTFLLRPFRGTAIEKTKLFAKYNTASTAIFSQQKLNNSKAKIPQLTPRLESARPFSYPPKSSVHPTAPSSRTNKRAQDSHGGLVKSPEPITRKIQAPMNSSITENTALSDFSVVSYDADYEAFWDVTDSSFEMRLNSY
jgi:hypothetical protein